jgi:hypothetical protein
MDFNKFISEIFGTQNIFVTALIAIGFVLLYLVLFRKQIWSIFDPLCINVISMGGAAFCVYYMQNYITSKYMCSFIATEISVVTGIFLAYFKFSNNTITNTTTYKIADKGFIDIFLYLSGSFFVIMQIISFSEIGIVLFREGVNHVSAYDGYGPIKALLTASRPVFIITLLYKYFYYKLSILDKFLGVFYIITLMLSGSKSAILQPIIIFYILNYYFYKMGIVAKAKVKIKWLIPIGMFPIIVLMITSNVDLKRASILFIARIIGSGDVFVMGYNDEVINSFSKESLFNYIFYPGFGSILKNLGFPIIPPQPLGPQIYEYYTGLTTSGPNTRLNYLGFVFLGPYWSTLFSFICGFIIGYIRSRFTAKYRNYLNLMLYVLIYCYIVGLIGDIQVFMNFFIWSAIVCIIIYFISDIIYTFLKIKIIK